LYFNQLRDFHGKLECLFTIILIIYVFGIIVPTEEAKLRNVEMVGSIFCLVLVGTPNFAYCHFDHTAIVILPFMDLP